MCVVFWVGFVLLELWGDVVDVKCVFVVCELDDVGVRVVVFEIYRVVGGFGRFGDVYATYVGFDVF